MAKFKCALFTSTVKVKKADGTMAVQPALTIVMETSMTKCFEGLTVVCDPSDRSVAKVISSTNQDVGKARDAEFINALSALYGINVLVPQDNSLASCIDEIELTEKIDLIFYIGEFSKSFNRPYSLNDKETKTVNLNRKTLLDFITANYAFDPNKISDFKFSTNSVVRKFALKKRQWDFEKFWKSSDITQEDKDYATARLDLDIAMSNSGSDLMKMIERTIFTDYPERNWIFNILFGDPSSGKTTFVETLCGLINAPLVKLTGDPTISMTKLIKTIGPKNVQRQLSKQEFIDRAKARGLTDEEIDACKDKISQLILSEKEVDVQLTEQESLILKCIKHHLPLVVFLDEVNMFTTLLMATLADVITSGYVNVGVDTYKDEGHNIMWFGAYNPNTYKCSPFEPKFRDRALTFCSEMPSMEQLISHKQRKVNAAIFGSSSVLSVIKEKVDELTQSYPEHAQEFANEFNLVSNIARATCPSSEAVQWFFDKKVDKILGKTEPLSFKVGEFTNYYQSDCKMATQPEVEGAIAHILPVIAKVNEILKGITVGIDSKNPDSSFYFYIPNRAIDYVIDLIFCYTSVEKAFYTFVYNLIPNGGTIKFQSSNNPAEDIAKMVCSSLSDTFEDLQQYLFSNISDADMTRQHKALLGCDFNVDTWQGCSVSVTEDEPDAVDVQSEKVDSKTDDEYLDELEDLVG